MQPIERPEQADPGALPISRRNANYDFNVVMAMIGVLVLSALIGIHTIEDSPGRVYTHHTHDPSPLGYTWSLALSILPAITLLCWFVRHPKYPIEKKPFWTTMLVLTIWGFCLDLFFANSFFTYQNQAATVGLRFPGYTFGVGWVLDSIPIEEFVFYFAGFVMQLLIYVWGNLFWFGHYGESEYRQTAQSLPRIISFDWPLAIVTVISIIAAILYKHFLAPPAYQSGFPGYFVFLLLTAIVPTVVIFKTVKPFVNWRAFSFSFFFLLNLSLLWEGALGVPYAWWGYRPEQMLGIIIKPLADLPIEAVSVWFVATWNSVLLYEVIKINNFMNRGFWGALFGKR